MIVHLYRRGSILVLRPGEFRLLIPDFTIVRSLVMKGLPMGFQMMVTSLAAVTMMSLVNRYGVHTSAAYGAAAQLWTYVQMPAMALGASVSSMAAQNVGAGKMDRVEQIARRRVSTPVRVHRRAGAADRVASTPGCCAPFLPAAPARRWRSPCTSTRSCSGASSPSGSAFIFSGIVRATGASGRRCWG
jgi:hypothetical protein